MEIKIDRSKWRKVRLGDVASEYSERINNPSESGFDRFVGNSNIGQWDFRIKARESTDSVSSAMKLFEPKDYLLVRRSLYASDFRERAPRADFSGVCSGDILTIRENLEEIADGFLIGVLNSPALWKFVVANASGSITRRIKWRDLANYEFLLPPKAQQAKIAELLWAIDGVISKSSKVLQDLDMVSFLKKSEFFINGNGHTETQAFTSFKVPKSWAIEKMSKVASVEYGISKSVANNTDPDLGWQIITGANIDLSGEFDLSKKRYIETPEKDRFMLKRGDLMFNWRSGSPAHIGKTAYFDLDGDYTYASFILRIRCGKRLIDRYAFYLLNFLREVEFFTKNISKQINFKINASIFREIEIPIPSIDEQNEMLNLMEAMYMQRTEISNNVAESQRLKKSLINHIF